MSRPNKYFAPPARELAEEAVHLLRAAPIAEWGAYYLGTIPFCATMVYFLSTMSLSPAAYRDLPAFAALLALLFAWMKTWQARFATQLMARLQEEPTPAFGPAEFWHTLCRQTPRQATGLLLLPIALATIFFYIPVYSFYQNLTALDGRAAQGERALVSTALAEAYRWKRQAIVLVWMLSPMLLLISTGMAWISPAIALLYGTAPGMFWGFWTNFLGILTYILSPVCAILWVNLLGAAALLGMLLKSYFDIDTMFAWAPDAAMNQGFLAGLAAACYLAMDPIMKAAYVVRCYHGIALHTGDDLRATLRRIATTSTVLLALLAAAPAFAADFPATTDDVITTTPENEGFSAALDRALDDELRQSAYIWRGKNIDDLDKGWLRSQVDRLSQYLDERIEAFRKWLHETTTNSADPDPSTPTMGFFGAEFLSTLGYVALVVLLGALLYIAARVATQQWKFYHQETAQLENAVVSEPATLTDEGTRADALPEEGWLQMANDLYARGEFRLAMRALFLATLAVLAERRFIKIVRHKSNAEYLREIRQRCAADISHTFAQGTELYEGVWYGEHPASPEGFTAMRSAHDKVAGR